MKCEVIDNLLYADGSPVAQNPSPNVGGEMVPTLILIHFTADDSEEGAISWLCARQAKVSAHLVVNKQGGVTQLVAFNRVA